MTKKPEIFKESDVYDLGLSDHSMGHAEARENAIQYPSKIMLFRSFKNLKVDELLKDLSISPWHVGNIFDSVDDQYFYWSKLVNDVLDNHARQTGRLKDMGYMTPE